ncbi:MAG: hypothetical protein WCA23_01120, partial [Stellaceae bacterium]
MATPEIGKSAILEKARYHFANEPPAGPALGCETASNRDPLPKQDNALITDAEFEQHGVPIGAYRNPG